MKRDSSLFLPCIALIDQSQQKQRQFFTHSYLKECSLQFFHCVNKVNAILVKS